MSFQNVMLDIETFSTSYNAIISTIGAIKFSRNDKISSIENCDTFYRRIERNSCEKLGFVSDISTMNWWNKQTEKSKFEVFTDLERFPIEIVLKDFSEWFGDAKYIWSHGSSFDIPILSNAYKSCNIDIPWKFWNIRDTRTIYDIGDIQLNKLKNTYKHHALYDCYNQIKALQFFFQN